MQYLVKLIKKNNIAF